MTRQGGACAQEACLVPTVSVGMQTAPTTPWDRAIPAPCAAGTLLTSLGRRPWQDEKAQVKSPIRCMVFPIPRIVSAIRCIDSPVCTPFSQDDAQSPRFDVSSRHSCTSFPRFDVAIRRSVHRLPHFMCRSDASPVPPGQNNGNPRKPIRHPANPCAAPLPAVPLGMQTAPGYADAPLGSWPDGLAQGPVCIPSQSVGMRARIA